MFSTSQRRPGTARKRPTVAFAFRLLSLLLLPLIFLSSLPPGASAALTSPRHAFDSPACVESAPATLPETGPRLTIFIYRNSGESPGLSHGLYYLRARYMNAANGRFWNADSYEGKHSDPQSLHKYLYANGDPVNGIDPSGQMMIGPHLVPPTLKYYGAFQKMITKLAPAVAFSIIVGIAAHEAIFRDYEDSFGGQKEGVFTNRSIAAILGMKGLAFDDLAMRPDIVNTRLNEAWEIKSGWNPFAKNLALSELKEYLDVMNDTGVNPDHDSNRPFVPGASYHPIVVDLEPYWIGYVYVDSFTPGALIYYPDSANTALFAYLVVSGFGRSEIGVSTQSAPVRGIGAIGGSPATAISILGLLR